MDAESEQRLQRRKLILRDAAEKFRDRPMVSESCLVAIDTLDYWDSWEKYERRVRDEDDLAENKRRDEEEEKQRERRKEAAQTSQKVRLEALISVTEARVRVAADLESRLTQQ